MKSKAVKIALTLLLVAAISVGGFIGYKSYAAGSTTVPKSSYITETIKRSDIGVNVSSTGTVFASVTKDIVSNNSGVVKGLNVKEGDSVKAGDKLFVVDSDQIRQQVSSAKINVEKQELQLDKMKTDNDISLQNLQIQDAKNSLNNANQQYNAMTVTAPINGVVTARNNNDGDNIQSGKAVLSVLDPASLKVKVSVDELDISKVKVGQKAQIKFNAIEGKNYDGTVESISMVGATTNNVTTYSVVINLNDKTGVMLGMTANATIQVESKQNALVVPSEALISRGDKKYVMVPNENSDTTNTQPAENSQNAGEKSNTTQSGDTSYTRRSAGNGNTAKSGPQAGTAVQGRLVEVKTGIQNENYTEITEGISEGQKVMVQLPQVSTTTQNAKSGNMGGFGFGGGMTGGGARTTTRSK